MKSIESWNAQFVIRNIFIVAVVFWGITGGSSMRQHQSSVQLLQNLEVFQKCKDERTVHFGLGQDGVHGSSYGRRLHQIDEGGQQEECTQIKRDLLSNAFTGECNVTNPTQLIALSDLETQNCCNYANKMITQHCFEPCNQNQQQQQQFESYGLASFWVAYCEVEYNCNQLQKQLPGNYSLAAVPVEAGDDFQQQQQQLQGEQDESMLAAVLTPAAQSQLHALASVHVPSAIASDDDSPKNDRYATLSNSQTAENIQEEAGYNYPRLSDETLQQIIAAGLPAQILDRSIVQNLNLMPDLKYISEAINQLPSIKQHLAQNNGKTYTLFAPTNQAFQDLARTLGVQVEELPLLSSWISIVKNLIVPGEHSLLQVLPGDKLQTLVPGSEIVWEHSILRQSIILKGCCDPVNSATLILGEIRMANGILHVIDKIILPPDAPFSPLDVVFDGN